MRSSITRVAAVAVPLASLISLTACRGVVVAASPGTGGTVTALATSSTAASTVTSAPATAATSSGGAATQAPGASADVQSLTLNDEGERGWEAIGMTPLPDGRIALLVKRPGNGVEAPAV